LGSAVEDVTMELKDALDIKKVPPRMRKKIDKEALRPDEGLSVGLNYPLYQSLRE
jgi:hypothetical protein